MGDSRGGILSDRMLKPAPQLDQSTGPEPGWFESIGAAFRVERDEQAGVQSDRLLEAYAPLLDALADLGVTRESLRQSQRNVLFGEDPLAVSMEQSMSGDTKGFIDYDRVWAAIEANRARNPKAFASLPKTRAEFEQRVLRRGEERSRDQDVASRGGIVPNLIGGVGASVTDPMQWPTLFVGGGGKTVATRILTEALAGAGVEAMMLDDRAEARARLGEDYTAGEMLADVGVSALASGTLAGGGELTRMAAPRVIDGVRAAWSKLPEAARKRWPDPAKLTEADLPDIAETLIGKGNLTEDEAAAITVLRRDAEVEASNPFVPDGAGTQAHIDRMEAAMERVLSDAPVPRETSAAVPQRAPPRAAPGAPMGAMAAIERNETGGGTEAARQRLVSPKGAVGVMQVMPTTGPEAAKLAGLPWDAQRFRSDADYNRALGQAYYREQLRVFGAADKAAAAYNAGPGALRNAMAKAAKAGNPDDWLRYMPAETRDYVAKFRTRTGAEASGGGVVVADDAGDGFAAEFERLNAEMAELERADAAMAPGESPAMAAAREAEGAPLDGGATGPSVVEMRAAQGEEAAAAIMPTLKPEFTAYVPPPGSALPKRTRPSDVIEWLADRGGIRDDEGHSLRHGRGFHRVFVPRAGPLLRPRGMSIDLAGELLHEAGFFPVRPTERDVLEMLDAAVNQDRKFYPAGDTEVMMARNEAMARAEAEGELDALAMDLKLDMATERELIEEVAAAVADGAERWDALEQAVYRRYNETRGRIEAETGDAFDDWIPGFDDPPPGYYGEADAPRGAIGPVDAGAGAGGRAAGGPSGPDRTAEADDAGLAAAAAEFADPNGPGAKAQVESLEHDLQMDAFGGPTAADVRASLERAGEGRMKGEVAQKPLGSDGGLFDARGEDIQFRFGEDDTATGAELLRRLEEEQAAIDLVEGCLPPKKPGSQ